MKKIVMLLILIVMVSNLEAKGTKDPIVMTVAGKDIPVSELVFMAKKDNTIDFNDRKSVEGYIDLFKNFKLKVADAEAKSIHEAPKFKRELENYKKQLQESFLSDKSGEKEAMRVVYERTKSLPGFKQILFRFAKNELVSADTVAFYNMAMDAYRRIQSGESFESVGESLTKKPEGEPLANDGAEKKDSIFYSTVKYIFPLQVVKVLEDKVYSMEPGEVSMPFRSLGGFHLIKLEHKTPNPGKVRVAQILTKYPSNKPTEEEIEETYKKAESIYQKIKSGEDFTKMANEYSDDTISGKWGGLMPEFGLGDKVESMEKAAFELVNIGDISEPFQTHIGFHILMLVDKKTNMEFEDLESSIYGSMKDTERNFELYKRFEQKMKERHGYIFYPEAYAELERLADEYFPTDTNFYFRGMKMDKPLIRLDTLDFTQDIFADYIFNNRFSAKTYSKDFMKEIFDLFVREILTEMEREVLERDYPEFNMVVDSYYDGILLMEISSNRVWDHPKEEQDELEAEWIKELNMKYPVTMNKKVIKNIKKYIN